LKVGGKKSHFLDTNRYLTEGKDSIDQRNFGPDDVTLPELPKSHRQLDQEAGL